jgi:hypothetical protein
MLRHRTMLPIAWKESGAYEVGAKGSLLPRLVGLKHFTKPPIRSMFARRKPVPDVHVCSDRGTTRLIFLNAPVAPAVAWSADC